jgi:hypothetical protein
VSERVMLYSSHPLTAEDLWVAVRAAGGEPVVPEDEDYDLLGRVEEGKRYVLISGRKRPMDGERFWETNLPYLGQELLEELCAKLGSKPRVSFLIAIGYEPRSGLLAVSFAYQCAIRWPCIVYADVYAGQTWEVKVYTKAEIEQLYSAGEAFTSYGMTDE